MRDRRVTKGLYVVKSEEDKLNALEPRDHSKSRGVYVLKTSEEIINKFADILYEFVDTGGLFFLIGNDKIFYQTLKRCIVYELGIETEFIQFEHEPALAISKIEEFIKKGTRPFVFLEQATEGVSNIQILTIIKTTFPLIPVIMTVSEVDKDHLLQFYENGASQVLRSSSSVNEIVRKIVHVLKPQTEIDELVLAGQKLNEENRFEDALRVGNTILTKRPKSARARMILGDAYRGLVKRREALAEYMTAEKNSKTFIEPLKKIFSIHAEDGNKEGMLDYLVKLDDLSPLNFNRKVKIGDLSYDLGKVEDAERYYDNAIASAEAEAKAIVGEMSLDIAEKLCSIKPELAAKYYKKSLDHLKELKNFSSMNTFNRLGISLRKAGLWEEAVEAYAVAEKMSPDDENIQYNMGLAYHEGRSSAEASKRMIMALRINPKMYLGNAEVAFNMGVVFKDCGNMPYAEKMIKHVLEIDPKHDGARLLGVV